MEDYHNLIEMFSSIQGEGSYVGYRQIFIRYSSCNLNCSYCDTPNAELVEFCRVEVNPGKRNFIKLKNPVSTKSILDFICQWKPENHHSVSYTGGEPLLSSSLKTLLTEIKQHTKLKNFLETNGTLPERFNEISNLVDIVSMDIKLPSLVGKDYSNEHKKFLMLANNKETFVKIIVTNEVKLEEFKASIDIIAQVNRNIPLILQPATSLTNTILINPQNLLNYQEKALEKLTTVRVIPQTHKFMSQL